MNEHRFDFAVAAMAQALEVSRSGYYAWCEREAREGADGFQAVLDERVRRVFDAHKGRYGAPRIHRELHVDN